MIANLHFQIGTGLRKSWRDYYQEIVEAHVFWQYTIRAHDTMAMLTLCRTYDRTRFGDTKCLTLPRFIATVETNPEIFAKDEFRKRLEQNNNPHVEYLVQRLSTLDSEQVAKDKAFCDQDAVKRLQTFRNKVIAHSDYEYSMGAQKDFSALNPFPFDDIQKLIDGGFQIVNRYSGLYVATTHSERIASREDQDYLNVLKALKRLHEAPTASDF